MEVDKNQERLWSNLPRDILKLISNRATKHSPWVMSFIDDVRCKFYHPLYEDKHYAEFPVLKDFNSRISSSNFGWLLMNEGCRRSQPFFNPYTNEMRCSLSFFNPSTNELMRIPGILSDTSFNIFHFSSYPTLPDCTIIAIKTEAFFDVIKIGIIKRGEDKWIVGEFDGKFKTSSCNTLFFEGRYYFMGDELNIGIFDVSKNEWKVCDKHIVPHRKKYLYRAIGMVEDNNTILVVYEHREHQQLHLARFDLSRMMWEKVDCLGADKVLYVSGSASYLEAIAAKDMGNRIYFPISQGERGVFYSLATKKYYSCDGKCLDEMPYKKLTYSHRNTWIKCNYSQRSNLSYAEEVQKSSSSSPIIFEWSDNYLGKSNGENALEVEH